MISVKQAWEKIEDSLPRMPAVPASLQESLGAAAAENIRAPMDLPPFPSSAMDGFAVRSIDTRGASSSHPVKLFVGKVIPAGTAPAKPLAGGQAARIFTGAVLPPGADSVIIQEHTKTAGGHVLLKASAVKGANIRKKGKEIKKGTLAVASGTIITPPVMGLLASLGFKSIRVVKKPSVSFFTTGSELASRGKKLRPGTIWDSHTLFMPAALRDTAGEISCLPPCPDELNLLMLRVKEGLSASDVLIATGGMSVGDYDLVRTAFERSRVRQVFWRVAMKPGKPIFFGTRGKKIVFGLPGNPAAALVAAIMFVGPALKRMAGIAKDPDEPRTAGLASDYTNKSGRTEFLRGRTVRRRGGRVQVRILKGQGSHMLKSFAEADCLITIPGIKKSFCKGDVVRIRPLPWVPR